MTPTSGSLLCRERPEYLTKGSGTFYADAQSIVYAPLDVESSSALGAVVAATPGLFELVSNNGTRDVSIEGLTFAHTDVDFEACFAGPCALQSATFVNTAAVHFEFSENITLHRCTVVSAVRAELWGWGA